MAYAAALITGLAALWLALSPGAFSTGWLVCGAAAIVVALVLAWRMRLLDREGAPYLSAPGVALLLLRRLPAIVGANLGAIGAALAFNPKLQPALIRLKTRAGDGLARATFVNTLGLTPGLLVVECSEDSVLIHALVEDDADEEELRALERQAWSAVGKGERPAQVTPQAETPA
jgi:multicomponent Na+:H+ antiporter subunit E